MMGAVADNGERAQTMLRRDDRFLSAEYRKVLFPIMLSVLGGTVNALIDSVFVSRRIGPDGLAAVNLSMPVYLALCVVGSLVASGASVLSAQAEGRDDIAAARKPYHTALTASLLLGASATLLGLVSLDGLSTMLAGQSGIRAQVEEYCRTTLAASTVFVVAYIPLNYLQLEGKTRQITQMILVMIGLDVAFDYLLLYPLDMGMTGAALASAIAMLVSCAFGFWALWSQPSNYRLDIHQMGFDDLGPIVRYGSPVALGNLYDTVKLFVVNSMVLAAGGEAAMALWAVLNTLCELSLVIGIGVPRAGSAMLGVYNSARENGGIRTLVRIECVVGIALSCLFGVLVVALSGPLQTLFLLPDPLLVPLACLAAGTILSTLCCILETWFNVAGRIALSNMVVVLRRLLLPVATLAALVKAQALLWLFLPLGPALALAVTLLATTVLSRASRKGDRPLSPVLLLDDSLTREHKVLDFSIPADLTQACIAAERISDFCALHDMNSRQVMRLGLAIEELLGVIVTRDPDIGSVDLRVFVLDDVTGIRIRCAGSRYDPFEDHESDEDAMMGIRMLEKMADVTMHAYTLGMNTVSIIFNRGGRDHA